MATPHQQGENPFWAVLGRSSVQRQERKIHTQQREAVRLFVEAIFWVCRSGAQWRLLPASYGAWNSVYKRFARWDELGVWARLFAQVADEPDLQAVMIDATVVRAHACAAGAPKKGWAGRAGLRAVAWWVQHEDSFGVQRRWRTPENHTDAGPGS